MVFGEPAAVDEPNVIRSLSTTALDALTALHRIRDGRDAIVHPITFHALRRTSMSLLEAEGVSRDLIGALAGHAGKTVSDRHYIAKNVDRFYEVVKQLPLPETLPWLPEPIAPTKRCEETNE